jgi:hypothetical protein
MKIVVLTDHLTKQPCDGDVPHERFYDRVPPSFGEIREEPLQQKSRRGRKKRDQPLLKKAAQKLF